MTQRVRNDLCPLQLQVLCSFMNEDFYCKALSPKPLGPTNPNPVQPSSKTQLGLKGTGADTKIL